MGGCEVKIVLKNIGELVPAEYNPRKDLKAGDPEYEKLKKSIVEFDYVDPVIWNERTGHVVGGHQRLKVLRELGREEIEVSVVDLSEQKEKALNLALNKVQGEWDVPSLEDLLAEIKTFDFEDVEISGFSVDEIEEILRGHSGRKEGLTGPDDVPEPPKEPVTKRGDIWFLGNHRLFCGDATVDADVQRLMAGQQADMLFTDPPYGVSYVGKTKEALTIQNDRLGDTATQQLIIDAVLRIPLKQGGVFYVCSPSGDKETPFRVALCCTDFIIHQGIAWVKNSMVLGHSDYHYQHETLLYGWREGGPHKFYGDRTQTTVWTIDRPKASIEHPTMKPIALCTKAIENSSKAGDLVWDSFGGSGSTLIACEQLDRKCYMMEIDPRYCDVIVKRWENFTGEKAIMAKEE
jgi:DNA modification methylase